MLDATRNSVNLFLKDINKDERPIDVFQTTFDMTSW